MERVAAERPLDGVIGQGCLDDTPGSNGIHACANDVEYVES
jgi:hypothetical protein